MQYKKAIKCNIIRNGVFHLIQYPGPFLHTRGPLQTFNMWSISSGVIYCMVFHPHHLIFWMMSVTVLPTFLLLWKSVTHFLRPCTHTDPQDKLYQQPPASQIKTEKENKCEVKPMRGWFHSPMGIPKSKKTKKFQRTPISPWPIHSHESCQSFITSLVLKKNFPSTLSTHFLYFHYSTLQFLQKK